VNRGAATVCNYDWLLVPAAAELIFDRFIKDVLFPIIGKHEAINSTIYDGAPRLLPSTSRFRDLLFCLGRSFGGATRMARERERLSGQ
jgi:hypothetical protein